MSAEAEEMMWQALTIIEAQETLIEFQVSSFPHAKQSEKEKIHRAVHKLAYPSIYNKPVVLTAEAMAALING